MASPGVIDRGALPPTPCSSPDMNSDDDLSDSLSKVPVSLINAENYITAKEGCQAAFTAEELTIAVNECKKLVLESEERSVERKWLVRRLIELRHRLQQAVESEDNNAIKGREETLVKLGHHFTIKYLPPATSKIYCDRCCHTIWNVIQLYYHCSDCNYKCHAECVEDLNRVCAHLVLSEKPQYETEICPEASLESQGYSCYECKSKITYNTAKGYYYHLSSGGGDLEARLCDYNGYHYCSSCHWNTESVIPARIRLNWDFQPKKVSRASYQLIRMSRARPLISLDERLYAFVQELAIIKKMREELGIMKKYILSCRYSIENGLMMREFEWGRYLVHSTTLYSLDDLCGIPNGTFMAKLEAIHKSMKTHITVDCDICKGRGYICEFCNDTKIIYGFDNNTHICPKCETVSHKFCWTKNLTCKKCLRKEQKLVFE